SELQGTGPTWSRRAPASRCRGPSGYTAGFRNGETTMSIQPGDALPEVPLQRIANGGVETVDTRALFGEGRTVLFAVPGAFTPTCSEQHLPAFVQNFQQFRDRGVAVACLSVNDPFVMQAWGESQGVPDGLTMLADGNAEFTRALGLELDASGYG